MPWGTIFIQAAENATASGTRVLKMGWNPKLDLCVGFGFHNKKKFIRPGCNMARNEEF
jgi:hypothetical protein